MGGGRREQRRVPRKARQPRTLKTPSGLDDSQETLGHTMCGHGGTRSGKGGKGQRGEALKKARKEGKKKNERKELIKKENDKNLLHCNYWLAFQTRVNGLNRLPWESGACLFWRSEIRLLSVLPASLLAGRGE